MKTPSWEQLTLMMSSLNQTLNNKIGKVEEIITTNTPHQQLVTDEEGNVKWEKKTHWIELKEPFEILSETQLSRETIEDPMLITTPLAAEIIPNNTYVVTLNGIEYTCVAQMVDDGTMVLPVLGNIGLMVPELFPNTGEPFMFAAVPPGIPDMEGASGMLMVFDEEILEATFKIVGFNREIVHKLNPKFVSSPDWDAAEGEEGHIKNRTHWIEKKSVVVSETTEPGLETINPLIEGNTYSVIWNGEEYFCIAKKLTIADITAIYLGNLEQLGSQYKTKEPFAILQEGSDGILSIDNANPDNLSPFTAQITEVEIHKLNPNFLEPSNWNASEGQLGYIANRTHWVEEAKEIFPPTTIEIQDPGDPLESWIFENEGGWPFTIEIGREYRVKYKDQTYDIVAKPHMIENVTLWVLGNSELQYLLGDMEPTGYDCPFLFIGLDEKQGWFFVDRNEPFEPVTVSINELNPVYHKLSQNFLPDYIYGYENDGVGGEVLPETVLTPAGGVLAYIETPFTEQLVDGQIYIVNYNNQSYECVAKEVPSIAGLETPSYVLGNLQAVDLGSEGSDIPFVLIKFLLPISQEDSGTTVTCTGLLEFVDPIDEDIVTLGVTKKQGKIIKVPEKFLPAYNWNAKESQEGHILNRTHWYHPEENHTWDGIIEGKENVLLTSFHGYFGNYKFSDTFLTKADLLTARVSVNGELLEEQPTEEDFEEHKNGKAICYSIENLTIWSISQDVCGSVFKKDGGDAVEGLDVIGAIYPSPGLYITGLNAVLSGTTVTLTIPESLKKLDPMFLPEISSVEIDPTLTVEGAAADAKVVGEAIDNLNTLVGDTAVSEQIAAAVENKSDVGHTHDDKYDTKGAANTALASAKTYADNIKNDLLNGAGAAYDTLKELGDLIDDNQDAIEALETVAASKASASDLASHTEDKSNPHGVTADQIGAVPTSRTVNGKALSSNISLSASDVGADVNGAADTALTNAKAYTDTEITEWIGDKTVAEQIASAVSNKANTSDLTSHTGNKSNPHNVTAAQVGAVPTSRTVNGKALSTNITLSASDVGALPDTTQIPEQLADLTDDATHRVVTDTEKAAWNAKSDFSGSYNDLTDKLNIQNGTAWDSLQGAGAKEASGASSIAFGYNTEARNIYSQALGYETVAGSSYQLAHGTCNIIDSHNKYLHIVGNGETPYTRSNAYTLDLYGNGWFARDVYVGGTSKDDGEKLVKQSELQAAVSQPQNYFTLIDQVTGKLYSVTMENGILVSNLIEGEE